MKLPFHLSTVKRISFVFKCMQEKSIQSWNFSNFTMASLNSHYGGVRVMFLNLLVHYLVCQLFQYFYIYVRNSLTLVSLLPLCLRSIIHRKFSNFPFNFPFFSVSSCQYFVHIFPQFKKFFSLDAESVGKVFATVDHAKHVRNNCNNLVGFHSSE